MLRLVRLLGLHHVIASEAVDPAMHTGLLLTAAFARLEDPGAALQFGTFDVGALWALEWLGHAGTRSSQVSLIFLDAGSSRKGSILDTAEQPRSSQRCCSSCCPTLARL